MSSLPAHIDVNVPASLLGRLGALLAEFERYLNAANVITKRTVKPAGGHITPWWLKARVGSGERSAWVTYGETTHASVNPHPHLWVRAPERVRWGAVRLLHAFADAAQRTPVCDAPRMPPPPTRPPPKFVATHDFDGTGYGPIYLSLKRGELSGPHRTHPLERASWNANGTRYGTHLWNAQSVRGILAQL